MIKEGTKEKLKEQVIEFLRVELYESEFMPGGLWHPLIDGIEQIFDRREKMILLGQQVKDVMTGFTGTAVSRIEYVSGCVQYGVKPKYNEAEMKGTYPPTEYIDEGQLIKLYPIRLEDENDDNGKDWIEKDEKTDPAKQSPGGVQPDRPRK